MRRLFNDLRALGAWAPMRVIYEVTRRTGVTGRVLRARWRGLEPPPFSSPWRAQPFRANPSGWTGPADEILAGSFRLLGRRIDRDEATDWHTDAKGYTWPRTVWWRIDLYADAQRDVKHVWELGRHRHLVILARAAAESPERRAYLASLNSQLRSWLEQNPPEIGVHWYSNLELAIRSLAWLEILALVGNRLDGEVRDEMTAHLYHSGRHILAELPYTLSSMRNNHLIGDAVGLVAIGRSFVGDRRARRWARLGDLLLRLHLPNHFAEDGASIEDSVGYRSFVLELLAARVALGDASPDVSAAAERAARHLARLGVASGAVPHIGDWDGGSALPGRVDGILPDSALAVAVAALDIGDIDTATTDGSNTGGGIGRVQRGPWTVWLKAEAAPSHGHADLLSVAVRHNKHGVVGDPGNGSYNRSSQERDYFRTSISHSVLRIEGEDQRVPSSRFRWRYDPNGTLGIPFELGAFRVMWGSHEAYERLDPPRRVLRVCLVSEGAVVVADWIGGTAASWQLSLPLHPDVGVELSDGAAPKLLLPGGTELGLLLPAKATAVRGSIDPYDGWWADDYDARRPSTRLGMTGYGIGPVVWGLWAGGAPDVFVDGPTLVVDGSPLRIEWSEDRHGRPIVGERT